MALELPLKIERIFESQIQPVSVVTVRHVLYCWHLSCCCHLFSMLSCHVLFRGWVGVLVMRSFVMCCDVNFCPVLLALELMLLVLCFHEKSCHVLFCGWVVVTRDHNILQDYIVIIFKYYHNIITIWLERIFIISSREIAVS